VSGNDISLRVSKRLLWVGDAVYPLQNIARVFTFTLKPRRAAACWRFLRRMALTLALWAVFTALDSDSSGSGIHSGDDDGGVYAFATVLAVLATIFFAAELLSVLVAPSYFVLSVETSGPSGALVTSRDPTQLKQLVFSITYAIENPQTEFQVTVKEITISSPKNYHFGDNVNIYGGVGSIGIKK